MKHELNGNIIHIATGGRDFDPAGNVLVMLHGSGQNHLTWVLQSRFLAHRGYEVLAPDFPGHGLSEGEPLTSIEAHAEWLDALLESLGVASASIIGHSQGCLTAIEMAASYKDRVSSLVLIAGALSIPVNDYLVNMSDKALEKAIAMMTSWGHGPSAHMHDNTQPGHSFISYGQKVMEINNRQALLADLNACNAYENGEAAAAIIDKPTLCIIAGKDKMTPPKAGRKMAASIASADQVIIDRAGHFLPAEYPMEVNAAIRTFLTK